MSGNERCQVRDRIVGEIGNFMNFILDIRKWWLINVSNCQYHSFKHLVGNQRNVTMTACAVGEIKGAIYPRAHSNEFIMQMAGNFHNFSVGIMSDHSYIFIEN